MYLLFSYDLILGSPLAEIEYQEKGQGQQEHPVDK